MIEFRIISKARLLIEVVYYNRIDRREVWTIDDSSKDESKEFLAAIFNEIVYSYNPNSSILDAIIIFIITADLSSPTLKLWRHRIAKFLTIKATDFACCHLADHQELRCI